MTFILNNTQFIISGMAISKFNCDIINNCFVFITCTIHYNQLQTMLIKTNQTIITIISNIPHTQFYI